MSGAVSADQDRAQLESQRDFLLQSLDDLDTERAAGNVDDESYQRLHDDYTARAARVIRSLGSGAGRPDAGGPDEDARRGVTRRRVLVGAAIAAVVVVAGYVLAGALGARLPGQTASGNSGETADPGPSRKGQLQAAIAKNPADIGTRLLLAGELEADSDYAGALAQYDEVIRLDPTSAAAYAQGARILYKVAERAPADQAARLVDQAKTRLDRSVEIDPEYADARFFRAIVLINEFQDFVGARNDLQRYLVAKPNGLFAPQARQLLEDVTNALIGTPISPSTTSPTPKPTARPTTKTTK
jgi:cytochrome c-type biogenesis protein CcmH